LSENTRFHKIPLTHSYHLNCECINDQRNEEYLGYVPDLEMKSVAYKTKQRLGLMGKRDHAETTILVLEQILESLKNFQGKDEVIRDWVALEIMFHKRLFFPVAFIIGDSQSQDKMCGRYLLMSICLKFVGLVM